MFQSSSIRPPTPPVVKNLIILNVVFFFIAIAAKHLGELNQNDVPDFAGSFSGFDVNYYFGLHSWLSPDFRPWQHVTHMFLHSTDAMFHLLFNMLGLWMFGSALEQLWGPKRFLFYYLTTGIGAGIVYCVSTYFQLQPMIDAGTYYFQHPSYDGFDAFVSNYLPGSFSNAGINGILKAWYPDQLNPGFIEESKQIVAETISIRINIPVVGASGALFGLLLAFGVSFPNAMIMMLIPPIPMKAKYFVFVFGLFELAMGVRNNLEDNVAHFAHLGGILFGIILVFLWKKQDRWKNV